MLPVKAAIRVSLVIITILIFLPSITYGKAPPPPFPALVPQGLPKQEQSMFLQQRAKLLDERNKLEQEIQSQRSQCEHVEVGTAQWEFCNKWRSKLGNEYDDYSNSVKNFNQDLIRGTEVLVRDLHDRVKIEVKSLKDLNLEKRAEDLSKDFEEWGKLADETKVEWEREILKTLLGLAKQAVEVLAIESMVWGTKAGTKVITSLNPPEANRWITWLKSVGLNDPQLFDAIRQVAYTSGKPEMRPAINYLLDLVGKYTHLVITNETKTDSTEVLASITGLAGWEFRFLTYELDFTALCIYDNISMRIDLAKINRLTKLNEDQLKSLKRSRDLLKDTFDKIKRAEQDLTTLKDEVKKLNVK